MKHVLTFLLCAVLLAATAQAEDRRCLISFDAASLDVCTGQVDTVVPELAPLADLHAFADAPVRLVKFDAPIRAEQRAALEALGGQVLGYAPHYAYLVRMSPGLDETARALPGVLWAGPFLPAFKLDINLARDLASLAKGGFEQTIAGRGGVERLGIALHPGAGAQISGHALLAVPGLELQATERGAEQRLVMRFDAGQLADSVMAVARNPDVASVSLRWDNEFMNSQADWLHQSGSSAGPNPLPIFEQGIFGCGQIVAAADSGLHVAHCSFSDADYGAPVSTACNQGSNCPPVTPDFDHRKIGAHYKWDAASGSPADGHGHGTHVMGSIMGNNPANAVDCEDLTTPGGLTDLDGTAPGAQIISQEMGSGLQYLNSLGGTIYHAAEIAFGNGARIHNNSWGSSCRNSLGICTSGCQVEYRQTTRDADRAVWDFPELALFVAAGNSGGLGGDSGCGPGADVGAAGNAKNVFSIGSNVRGTSGNNMSGFSSRGPTSDRRSKPDMTAQGSSIVSAQRNACGTRSSSGTSMATPTAAGLAALVREYLQRGFHPSGMAVAEHGIQAPSGALIKAIMINGAQEITGSGTTGGAPSQSQGWGRVNLGNSLYFQGDSRMLWLHDGKAGLQTNAVDYHLLHVEAGEPLIVTLAWHDAPALVNANPHTVNTLRLEVEEPDGTVWTQKLPASGGLTDPNPFQDTGSDNYDLLNNVHQVRIDAPDAGAWQVRVRGIQVAEGPQPYAVVATGAIAGLTDPSFLLGASPQAVAVCSGEPIEFELGLRSFEGFNDAVTLSASGLPAGASASFSLNPVLPADPATAVTLAIDGTIAAGSHGFMLEADSNGPAFPAVHRFINLGMTIDADVPTPGALLLPANGASNQIQQPQFSWEAFAGAVEYRFELSATADFASPLVDVVVAGTSYTLPDSLANSSAYYWRVSASNSCGTVQSTQVFNFRTVPAPGDCDADSEPVIVFHEDFSGGLGGFTTSGSTGPATWALSTARPSPAPASGGNAVLAVNHGAVSDQRLVSPPIELTADHLPLTLQFWNQQTLEDRTGGCFDGGLLEMSSDGGGSWQQVTNAQILNRAYDGPIDTGWSNPLAGRDAWCGDPRDWENYLVDLNNHVGQTVQFRWRLGTDSSVNREGWYVDDIKVQGCAASKPHDRYFADGFECGPGRPGCDAK
ncbi:MAG: S8 family serine peptidase [Xanthomonadales bacterium]|nr:S8 family serine peptidase [Xanthomonadales bacterium]